MIPSTKIYFHNICISRSYYIASIRLHYFNKERSIPIQYLLNDPFFIMINFFCYPNSIFSILFYSFWRYRLPTLHPCIVYSTTHKISLNLITLCFLLKQLSLYNHASVKARIKNWNVALHIFCVVRVIV